MKYKYLTILLLVSIILVFAHQPRLTYNENLTIDNAKRIENPEISQAFYGELRGQPDYYKIDSDKDFNLYVNLVVPDIQGARKDFSVDIKTNDTVIVLDAKSTKWDIFFEKFAGDNYFNGPEYEAKVVKGTYLIKVYNPDNQGKYSLAIGKIEEFPPKETVHAIVSLPKLKSYFQKSPLTAYFNFIGLFLLVTLIILAGVVMLIVFVLRRIFRRKQKTS